MEDFTRLMERQNETIIQKNELITLLTKNLQEQFDRAEKAEKELKALRTKLYRRT